MDLESIRQAVKIFRLKLAFIVFGIFIAWPIFHIVVVNNFRMSSWRVFGWGMYATPNPEAQSRLRVVIRDKTKSQAVDLAQLNWSLAKLGFDPATESLCINLFLEEPGQTLRKLPRNGLCQNNVLARDLDYFMHFGSSKHLTEFIKGALSRADQTGSEAYAFLTHQRFNLFQRKTYLESDIYKVSGDEVQYLGKIKNAG